MKKVLFILLALTIFNCSPEDSSEIEQVQEETLIGRWNLVGFEGSILYEFTADKRFTMYATDGSFETVAELIDSGRVGNDYWYEGSMVTVDLNFGNTSTLTPQFKCGNNVVDWLDNNGEIHSSMFRENFDYTSCN